MQTSQDDEEKVISPAELNGTTEEALREHISLVLEDASLDAGTKLPAFAPFITYEMLFRIHAIVREYSMQERAGWPKQAAVAKVVASVTGAGIPYDFTSKKDFEGAGNIMDAALAQYSQQRQLARKGQMKSARKALKAGREAPSYTRLIELQEKVYRCARGCTPSRLLLPVGAKSNNSRLPIHSQPTRWTAVNPDKQFERMQVELIAHKNEPAEVPILQGILRSVLNTAEVNGRMRMRAEQDGERAKETQALQKAELEKLRDQHAQAKKELRKQQAASAAAIAQLEKKNLVLGAQIARAVQAAVDEHQQRQSEASKAAEAVQELHAREVKLREAKARMAKEAREAREQAERTAFFQRRTEEAARILSSQSRLAAVANTSLSTVLPSDSDDSDDGDPDFDVVAERKGATASSRVAANEAAITAKDAEEAALALKRMREMPSWQAVRGKGAGRGACKIEWGTRVVIYSLLAMMVPCSAIGMVIVAIVSRTAPWLKPTSPTADTVRRCRFELRFVEEACSARRMASAYKVCGIGFDETTKLGNAALTSNVTIQPTEGAPLEDVILRAAYCPAGGTAAKCVESIDRKCFTRLRDMLRRWEAKFHQLYPSEQWTGPHPSLCGLHRLGGGGAIMSDTCNTARASKKALQALIAREVEENIGAAAWQAMSMEEQRAASRTHQHDCWQHLRNIFLAEMSRAQAAHMKEELKDELETFASWERMSTDYSQLLRATYKEFHQGCRYYKGKGKEYEHWLREHHPKAFVVHLERADGGRQDLDYDAALPIYIDRKYFIEYLHGLVFGKDHSNILEDFLYVVHRSQQFIAATRANAIIDLLVSRPMRWLSGNSHRLNGWSPYSMGEVLDLVEQFFMRAQHDGSLFLDPTLDIFQPIAAEQPLFEEWRKFTFSEYGRLSPDGSVKHLVYTMARNELLAPADLTNISTRAKTIEYLEVQCTAALRKMHDPKLALADKLSSQDGCNSIAMQAEGHADTMGCHATNDSLAESVFGTFDYILRRFGSISQEAASGVAQAVRSKVLAFGNRVAHRKASKKAEDEQQQPNCLGWFHKLPTHEQEALVELARVTVSEMRDIDRKDHMELDEYRKARRKANEDDELDSLFTRYALTLSFYDRWKARGVKSVREIHAKLTSLGEEGVCTQEKLDWLREQIEMRSIGLGWTEFKGKWFSSSDESTGTVAQLKAHLCVILTAEAERQRKGQIPEDCPAPLLTRKTFKSLGTPTIQADSLSDDRINLTSEEVHAAAQQRRRELELAGEIDWVGDRQPHSSKVPLDNTLIGVEVEVRWRYRHKESGEPIYIWAPGEVVQVADGEKDKKSARSRKILPSGAVRIKFPQDVEYDEAETFVWCILNPNNFNKEVHLGWRLTAHELLKREATAAENRASKRSKI